VYNPGWSTLFYFLFVNNDVKYVRTFLVFPAFCFT